MRSDWDHIEVLKSLELFCARTLGWNASDRRNTGKDGNVKEASGKVGYTEVTTTTDIKDKVITAKLLKYKG